MQTKESEKSNLELPAFRVAGANSVSRTHRKTLIALALIAAGFMSIASAQETRSEEHTSELQSPAMI